MEELQNLTCFGCRHHRVTHDPAWPYACLRFSIRSRHLPSIEVELASGSPCAAREPRESFREASSTGPYHGHSVKDTASVRPLP